MNYVEDYQSLMKKYSLQRRPNEALTEETNYLKAENQTAVKNLNDLDKEYIIQIKDLKKREAQKDHEIIFLKAENEKHSRDINKIESVYKTQVTELKKSIDQQDNELKIKNDQLRKNVIIQDTPETALKDVTSVAPVEQQQEKEVKELVTLATGKTTGHNRETHPNSTNQKERTASLCTVRPDFWNIMHFPVQFKR